MKPKRSDARTLHRAAELRKQPSAAEVRLWSHLRLKQVGGIRFRRQHAIGPFIVDFCAPRHKLIIELDGSVHHDQVEYDRHRTAYLHDQGYRVLRFWNNQVMLDIDSVLDAIQRDLAKERRLNTNDQK